MKGLVLGMLMTFGMAIGHAGADDVGDGCVNCGHGIRGVGGKEALALNKDVRKIAMSDEDSRLRVLGETICAAYTGAGNKVAENVKYDITKYIKTYEKNLNPNNTADIIKFLNRNKNKILCENGTKSYMMAAFDHGAHTELYKVLLFGELFDKKGEKIDVNAVSPAGPNGKLLTVLDYLDVQLATSGSDGYKREVKSVRRMMVKYFKAKTFADLPPAIQQQYNAHYKN